MIRKTPIAEPTVSPLKKPRRLRAKQVTQKSIDSLRMQRDIIKVNDLLELGLTSEPEGGLKKATPVARKYDPTKHPFQAYAMCAQMGSTIEEISNVFAIDKSTLEKWMRWYPEMGKAIRAGRDVFTVARIERSLIKRALGYNFDEVSIKTFSVRTKDEIGTTTFEPMVEKTVTTKQVAPDVAAIIFYLKNRCNERWKDKQEVLNLTAKDGKVTRSLKNMRVEDLKMIRSTMKKALTSEVNNMENISIEDVPENYSYEAEGLNIEEKEE